MSLLVPNEFKKDIDRGSGYIRVDSVWADKELKGLFLAPANQQYLAKHISNLVTQPQFIADTVETAYNPSYRDDVVIYNGVVQDKHRQLAQVLRGQSEAILEIMPQLMEAYPIPYDEDWSNANRIHQLHFLNRKFMLKTGRVIVQTPEMLAAGYENINPDTGENDFVEYGYSAASYADGVWRPEHLFTQSRRNEENPYWVLRRVEFSDAPDARGPGNKWKEVGDYSDERGIYDEIDYSNSAEEEYNRLYHDMTPDDVYKQDIMSENGIRGDPIEQFAEKGMPIAEASPMKRKGRFSKGAQVPFWQYTVQSRPYDRLDPNGLREGGTSDRRTNPSYGYDMRTLTNRSSVEKRKVPLQKHYF